jgi:PAS domain S-box-containing protein
MPMAVDAREMDENRIGRGPFEYFALGCVILVALLWGSLFYHIHALRETETAQARRDTVNLATALAGQVSRLVAGTDQVMRLIQDDFRRDSSHFDGHAWLARTTGLAPLARQIAIFDENGDLVALQTQPTGAPPRVNIADRDYFVFLATHPDAGLHIGRTLRGRIQHIMVIQISRRLEDASGRFKGVLVVSLSPDVVAKQFDALDIGRLGSVSLVGFDGFVRARRPATPSMYESPSPDAAPLLAKATLTAVGAYQGEADGDKALFGYRRLDDLPLVVSVRRSMAEVLAPLHREEERTYVAGAIATLIVAAIFALLARQAHLRDKRERLLQMTARALREAETSFRSVFEASPDIMCVHRVAPDGTVTLDIANKAAAAARGLDSIASRGRRLDELLPSAVAKQALAHIAAVVDTRALVRTQDNKTLGGDDQTYETVLMPLFEHDGGRVSRVFVSIRDVTHLRRAEIAAAHSETRYRMLAETTSDVITRLSLTSFKREYASPGCRRLFGFEPHEMMGRSPGAEMHPQDAPLVQAAATAFIARNAPDERLTTVYRARHKAGHWIWVESCLSLARDDAGKPEALVCSIRDITGRRDAEAAIEASEMRFRLLAENSGEMILLGHDDGRVSYVSPASMRLLGYAPSNIDTARLRERLHPDDMAPFDHAARRLAGYTAEAAVVCRAQRRDGAWIWIEGVFRRIAEARGDQPTIVATFRDVSDRQAQSLALREAKEAAEAASQAKTDFLAAMSHEIRTPLNGILGYTDLLLQDPGFAGGRRQQVERIRNAGSALRTVVDDILDFSTIEAGHIELEPLPFSPAILADGAISIVRGGVGSKRLDIRTVLDPDVPQVLIGDEGRLRQILLNLLNNAVKFTPAGSVTLAIARCGDGLRFTITDTGIGIPADKRSRLFERFSQVDGSIRREYGGTGLGLAICKSLVAAMGGTIGVEAAAPHGSIFWFDLQLPRGTSLLELATIEPEAVAKHSALILLAEDNEINQDLARAVIENAGHRLDIVADGAAAIQAVRSKRYDLVLMDVQMPILDGISATRHIRQMDHGARDVPIVAMSANVMPAQVAELLACGMNDHVGKPFKQRDLHAAIARWAVPTAPATDTGIAPLDRGQHQDLVDAVGEAKVKAFLAKAIAEVEAMVTRPSQSDRQVLASDAHALVSVVGTLGLSELAALLRQLEETCARGDEPQPILHDIEGALRRVETVISPVAA